MEKVKPMGTSLTQQNQISVANCLAVACNLPDFSTVQAISRQLVGLGTFEIKKALQAYEITPQSYKENRTKDINSVFESNTASLATFRKYRGEAITLMWITNRLQVLARFFSVGNGIHEEQLEYAAGIILEQYFSLTISDFKVFSKMAVSGKFGKTYNRFDIPIILEWLEKYWSIRCETAARIATTKKRELDQLAAKPIPMPENMKKLIGQLTKKTDKQKIQFDEFKADQNIMNELKKEYEKSSKKITYNDFLAIRYVSLTKCKK